MFAPPAAEVRRQADGVVFLRSSQALESHERCVGEYLVRWARDAPARAFLMERAPGGGWRGLTYEQALEQVRALGGWLLGQNLSAERPVVVLSGNSIEHAVLMLACLHVGIPIAAISPAYSLLSNDFVKLGKIVATLRPGLIYAANQKRFAAAISAIGGRHDAQLVVDGDGPAVDGALPFGSLHAGRPSAEVENPLNTPMHCATVMVSISGAS